MRADDAPRKILSMDVWFSAGLSWSWLAIALLLLLLGVLAAVVGWRARESQRTRQTLAPPPAPDSEALAFAAQEPEVGAEERCAAARQPEDATTSTPPLLAARDLGVVLPAATPEALPPPVESMRGPTRHPLVLVHGVLGFDRMKLAGIRVDYFRGVTNELRRNGFEVHVVRVDPLAPIPIRAAQLAEQVMAWSWPGEPRCPQHGWLGRTLRARALGPR